MGAPGPLSSGNLSSRAGDITDWLPLLGSILQALSGGVDDRRDETTPRAETEPNEPPDR